MASTGSGEVAKQMAGRKLPWSEIIAFVAIAGIVLAGVIGGIPVYPGHLGGSSLPLAVGAILAMFASGAAAAIIALPALRLRADYLAIATLAFASILQIFANNLQSVTGGAIGITGIPKP